MILVEAGGSRKVYMEAHASFQVIHSCILKSVEAIETYASTDYRIVETSA